MSIETTEEQKADTAYASIAITGIVTTQENHEHKEAESGNNQAVLPAMNSFENDSSCRSREPKNTRLFPARRRGSTNSNNISDSKIKFEWPELSETIESLLYDKPTSYPDSQKLKS